MDFRESATSSYLNNGQGGIINIILRRKNSKDNPVWGSASLHLSHPVSVSPQFTLGYNKKKLYLAALVLSDVHNNTVGSEDLTFQSDKFMSRTTSTNTKRFRSQLANVMMEYWLTSRDMLKLKLAEAYTYERHTQTRDYDNATEARTKQTTTTHNAVTNYMHTTRRTTTEFEINYKYAPISK